MYLNSSKQTTIGNEGSCTSQCAVGKRTATCPDHTVQSATRAPLARLRALLPVRLDDDGTTPIAAEKAAPPGDRRRRPR